MQTQITDKLMEAIIEEEWLISLDWHWNIESKPLVSYSRNPINVTTLYEAFLQYDDKPMITGADAVTSTIQKYCYNGEFNVAFGEEGNYSRIYHRENIFGLDVTERQYWLIDKNVMPQDKVETESEDNKTKSENNSHTPPDNSPHKPDDVSSQPVRQF